MRYDSVIQTIGRTPLVALDRICGDRIPAKVYGKVESYNPGQSAKDRAALYMIEQAEKKGRIKPGATLIEATSGQHRLLNGHDCRREGLQMHPMPD